METLRPRLADCSTRDQRQLQPWFDTLLAACRAGRHMQVQTEKLAAAVAEAAKKTALRRTNLPKPGYPAHLPVVEQREKIATAIAENQVVVICGQTGSGKTTQLPKICLDLGRGIKGMIGHTQPRRLAARTVAARIAQELRSPLGHAVGYKVRFNEQLRPQTYIKLMTDGILLAETQGDLLLEQYDTLIIDEAHERSLNIDFLLGYIKQLLPQRPDLKVIITSATIDPERFATHFACNGKPAPVIEVSGRTYPVEVHYRPILTEEEDEEDPNILRGIVDAVQELTGKEKGDILIFLSGEREIRETAEALTKAHFRNTEILPLYARLSFEEQSKIFTPHHTRRIVLATNVAETSLTVPGIKYVIDPGFARISRYSAKTKVQRLPIEKISQASAEQRKGRCGRVSAGICLRLYSEEDYLARPIYTDPEVLRTNLASVILQMKSLNLGDIEQFPFLTPPDARQIRDGYQTLFELGAIDEQQQLSPLGLKLARLPLDPRIGRMILAAQDEGVLEPVLIIAAALSVQDPRLRPMEAQDAADEAHLQFRDPQSDFLSFLKLWEWFERTARELSQSQMRKLCVEKFVSYIRMHEWQDIYRQIKEITEEIHAPSTTTPRKLPPGTHRPRTVIPRYNFEANPEAIHRAILCGLLSNVGYRTDSFEYVGAHGGGGGGGGGGRKFNIFPGSALFKQKPPWVMAAEIVETAKLYARTVAPIRPHWLEKLAAHLIHKSYSELRWNSLTGRVEADEQIALYGMVIIPRRRVHYGPIDPKAAREIFLRYALLEGDYRNVAPLPGYIKHNHALLNQVHQLEAKTRRLDLLKDSADRLEFFNQRVPEGVNSAPRFESWRRQAERVNPKTLCMQWADVVREGIQPISETDYPNSLKLGETTLPLTYTFAPGEPEDGITVTIPLTLLSQLAPERFTWIVPGLLLDKITALMKSLPTAIRRTLVPVPQYAQAAFEAFTDAVAQDDPALYSSSLQLALSQKLGELSGTEIPLSAWRSDSIPEHLHLNFRIIDEHGTQLAQGRDLVAMQERLAAQITGAFVKLDHPLYNLSPVWSWDDLLTVGIPDPLPERVELKRHGMKLFGYPALMAAASPTPPIGSPSATASWHLSVKNTETRLSASSLTISDDAATGGIVAQNMVALGLLDTPDAAQVAMREGLIRLLILSLQTDLRHLAHNFPEKDRIYIHYAIIGTPAELRNDLLHAIVEHTFLDGHPEIRSKSAFLNRREECHPHLMATATSLAGLMRTIMELYHHLTLELERPKPADQTEAHYQIQEQLDALLPRHFVARTPVEWLTHFPRYLQAIQIRMQKLEAGHIGRDARHAREIDILWQTYLHRQARHQSLHICDPELIRFRWMIEELRVSLFAQELSTALPVSVQRLEKQLGLIHG